MDSAKNTFIVFGYGSLMNDESRLRSAPDSRVLGRDVLLSGYKRIFNIAYGEHVYANIQPNEDAQIAGVVMQVTPEGFDNLLERECHYECVDVSDCLAGQWGSAVYAFIGQDNTKGGETVKQSYIDLCLSGVSPDRHEQWLAETIMPFEIDDAV